jgi:hypothetical protein
VFKHEKEEIVLEEYPHSVKFLKEEEKELKIFISVKR